MCGTYDMYIPMYAHDMLAYADFFTLYFVRRHGGAASAHRRSLRMSASGALRLNYIVRVFTLDDHFLDDFCHATCKRVNVQRSIVQPW